MRTWPPFGGELGKRFAYEIAIQYLADTAHNLSKKDESVGTDWVKRKISFLPGARYHAKTATHAMLQEETWFIPFQKKDPGKTAKKLIKAGIEAGASAADTFFGTAPPGFAPIGPGSGDAIWDDMNSYHNGTKISKHISGQGLEFTDLLIWAVTRVAVDEKTRNVKQGGEIAKKELSKLLNDYKTCWIAVEQKTPVRPATKEVFHAASVSVGPSSDSNYHSYVGGRSHGHRKGPFFAHVDRVNGDKGAQIEAPVRRYRRLTTDAMITSGALVREEDYDVMQMARAAPDTAWHKADAMGSIGEAFALSGTRIGSASLEEQFEQSSIGI